MPPSHVVVVESPAKAKTINKYLGSDYEVLASYGHIRDLPAKDGSVRPDEDFAMDWELGERSRKHVEAIAKAAEGGKTVVLATDPDREGEAISWHVQQVLRGRKSLKNAAFQRVTFNEITRPAVLEAMRQPRAVDEALVQAYLARRALDYLVGFTLSPVLWRKLPGSRSAGRVQSVALRLVCEREAEIEAFRPREYWAVEVLFRTAEGSEFTARLTHLDGRRLDRFDLGNEAAALAAVETLQRLDFTVGPIERKQIRRNPYPPFTTSTLQQEASRKLGFGASRTMRVAQRLYEGVDLGGETVGLITYMRTDGLQLAEEAIAGARQAITGTFGPPYLPDAPRRYKSTAKNAQEAHEAIRPTDFARRPEQLARYLEPDELRLYELIWKRTIACQMASAVIDQVTVDIVAPGQAATLRATGSTVRFDGFLKVYEEDRDDPAEGEDGARRLPPLTQGQALERRLITPSQHFTQPPPRYTEASLVKRMEELGIGRPSTYASILQVLQDRAYVRLEKKRFVPEDRGRLVTAFLSSFFHRYVEYDFTAKLETLLDEISAGKADWKDVLRTFWAAFSAAVEGTRDLSISQVITALDEELGPHFFPPRANGDDPRRCPACGTGRLGLKLSRTGAFIGCSNYPECRFTRPLEVLDAEGAAAETATYPRQLGPDPETGEPITIRQGPFGFYAQRGEGEKPHRVSLTKLDSPAEIDLARALGLLALPREIGVHEGEPVSIGIGRYGPYVRKGKVFKSLDADDDVLAVGMNRAIELLAGSRAAPRAEPLRQLGPHPADGAPVEVLKGRFGPYVKHGRTMASLPKRLSVEELTMEDAVALLAAKAGKSPARGGRAKQAAGAKEATAAKAKPAARKQATGAKEATAGKAKPAARKKAAGAKEATAGKAKPAARKTAAGNGTGAGAKKAGSGKPASARRAPLGRPGAE